MCWIFCTRWRFKGDRYQCTWIVHCEASECTRCLFGTCVGLNPSTVEAENQTPALVYLNYLIRWSSETRENAGTSLISWSGPCAYGRPISTRTYSKMLRLMSWSLWRYRNLLLKSACIISTVNQRCFTWCYADYCFRIQCPHYWHLISVEVILSKNVHNWYRDYVKSQQRPMKLLPAAEKKLRDSQHRSTNLYNVQFESDYWEHSKRVFASSQRFASSQSSHLHRKFDYEEEIIDHIGEVWKKKSGYLEGFSDKNETHDFDWLRYAQEWLYWIHLYRCSFTSERTAPWSFHRHLPTLPH